MDLYKAESDQKVSVPRSLGGVRRVQHATGTQTHIRHTKASVVASTVINRDQTLRQVCGLTYTERAALLDGGMHASNQTAKRRS